MDSRLRGKDIIIFVMYEDANFNTLVFITKVYPILFAVTNRIFYNIAFFIPKPCVLNQALHHYSPACY